MRTFMSRSGFAKIARAPSARVARARSSSGQGRGIPLQVIDENDERVFRPRKHANEPLEHSLKPQFGIDGREDRYGRLWAHQSSEVGNEIGQQAALIADSFLDRVSPAGDVVRMAVQQLTPIDDISANSGQIALWARAGAVDPARLRRMTLAARNPRRPRAWFLNRDLVATRMVISTPPSPVCPACFDDDWVAGHDGYLRASWLLAERCVCPAHGRMLIDQCPSCHAHVHVAFRLRENRARAVCARCEGALELGAGEGDSIASHRRK